MWNSSILLEKNKVEAAEEWCNSQPSSEMENIVAAVKDKLGCDLCSHQANTLLTRKHLVI